MPGMQQTIMGVDRTTFDVWQQTDQFLQPVVYMTCDQQIKYTDPFTGNVYDMPDQFSKIIAIKGSPTDITTFLTQNTDELKSMMWPDQSDQNETVIGSLSSSQSVDQTTRLFVTSNLAVGLSYSNVLTNIMYLADLRQLNISAELSDYIQLNLTPPPVFNNQSASIYNKMFQTFGTDYSETAGFGGEIVLWYYTNKALYAQESIPHILTDATNYLYNIILDAGGTTGVHKNISDQWIHQTTTNIYWRGGSAPSIGVDYNHWINTVPSDPMPVGSNLQPIYNLFWSNPPLQQNTRLAWTNYLDIVFLRTELTNSLDQFLILLGNIRPIGVCDSSYGICASYPDNPSCATNSCPADCPNSTTYCGVMTKCCTVTSTWNSSINLIMGAVQNLTNQIITMQRQVDQLLDHPTVDHQTVVVINEQYQQMMDRIESNPRTIYCSYAYIPSNLQCTQWNTVGSKGCATTGSQSIASACPYKSSSGNLASLWYPEGLIAYSDHLEKN